MKRRRLGEVAASANMAAHARLDGLLAIRLKVRGVSFTTEIRLERKRCSSNAGRRMLRVSYQAVGEALMLSTGHLIEYPPV